MKQSILSLVEIGWTIATWILVVLDWMFRIMPRASRYLLIALINIKYWFLWVVWLYALYYYDAPHQIVEALRRL